MKYFTTITAVVAFATVASAVPKPDAEAAAVPDHRPWFNKWCQVPGSPCFSKREAAPEPAPAPAPVAEADPYRRPWFNKWCQVPGSPCFSKREAAADRRPWFNKWCQVPGSPCFSKREAAAAPAAEAGPDHRPWFNKWCQVPGSPCFSKREAAAAAAPEAYHRPWFNKWCQVPGSPCFSKRSAEADYTAGLFDKSSSVPALKARSNDNSTDYLIGDAVGACGKPGEPCDMVKRAAFAINDILQRHGDADAAPCSGEGSFCERKRRELGEIAETALDGYDLVVAREAMAEAAADPNAEPAHRPWFNKWCQVPGSPCFSKRSDEEADYPSTLVNYCDNDGTLCARKRTADPEYRANVKRCVNCHGHCTIGEQICHKFQHMNYRLNHPGLFEHHKPVKGDTQINWCGTPGSPCISKKDAPPEDQAELTAPGGVADALYEIKGAIAKIKGDAQDAKAIPDPLKKLEHCEQGRCSPVTHAHLHAEKSNKAEADKANDFAWGPYGPSSYTQAYFNDLERRVDAAVDSLED